MKPMNVACPDCGGPMISRKSRYGMFWGCRDYPQCHGTRDSEGRAKQDRQESDDNNDQSDSPRWDR